MNRPISGRFDRRRFLKRSAAVAGAVAAPCVITSTALGAEGRPPASERVVTAGIGVGPRGLLNVREQLGCPDTQVVAICAVDAHYKNADCKAYTDFRELLARDDIDAVTIGSPDHWHVPMTIAAAKAGKDVCVEKPLGVSIAQDLICRETIKRYDRVFQYGTEARAMAACRLGAELVRNGRIGEVREIRVKAPNSKPGGSTTPKPVPPELEYDLWLGPAPWRPYTGCPDSGGNWFHVYDYAIGFVAGWGAHPLDLLQWSYDTHLTGAWEVEGTGDISKTGTNDAVYNWNMRFQFANGVSMTYWATGLPKDEHPKLKPLNNYAQLIGTEGWIAVYYNSMICEPESLKTVQLGPNDIRLPVSRGQERNFIECVKSRKTPASHVDDAVRSDIISHVSDIAIRVGRKIKWDPVKEEIIGDDEARSMCTRAMRAPWRL